MYEILFKRAYYFDRMHQFILKIPKLFEIQPKFDIVEYFNERAYYFDHFNCFFSKSIKFTNTFKFFDLDLDQLRDGLSVLIVLTICVSHFQNIQKLYHIPKGCFA